MQVWKFPNQKWKFHIKKRERGENYYKLMLQRTIDKDRNKMFKSQCQNECDVI